MVKLREISRTATFAWSPCEDGTWLVTGTIPGVIDASFSNTMDLEFWQVDMMDWSLESFELAQPNYVISSDMRFNDIAWGCVVEGHKLGIIAGAMENGALNLWDVDLIRQGASKSESLIAQNMSHGGIIKSLDFNTTQTTLLASAGENGEIWIWDMESPTKPYSSGQKSNQLGSIQSVAFNKDQKVPYILATAGNTGIVSVWDLRAKKAIVNLQFLGIGGGKKGISSVTWHPDFATKVITASEEDTSPVILMWDLRNSHAPEKILSGHEAGILSVSWCNQDSGLLLSCGKDNRTLCWDPFSGELIGEFPRSSNWVFRTAWSLKNPDVIANASYDGKIIIQTTQTIQSQKTESHTDISSCVSNADFYDNIRAYTRPLEASLLLKKPPKWLSKKCGASFGFGGKLVIFGNNKTSGLNGVNILNITDESSIAEDANNFEEILKSNDFKTYCQKKIQAVDDHMQKKIWEIFFILLHEDSRDRFVNFFGFKRDDIENEVLQKINEISLDKKTNDVKDNQDIAKSKEDLEDLFKKHETNNDFLQLKLSNSERNLFCHLPALNEPFSIFKDDDSDLDKVITKSVFLGQFDKAVDLCLQEDRLSDALMFSFCGGKECQKRAQRAYFKKHSNISYIRLLSSIIEGNLWDVVLNTNLKDWKEILATICIFSNSENFSELCDALGDRINIEFRNKDSDLQLRNNAVLCYLIGARLGKLIDIWVEEFQEKEASIFKHNETDESSNLSPYFIYAKHLQEFVEKIAIFKHITKSDDIEKLMNSNTLSLLYKKYNDYADIMIFHRNFNIAQKYLCFLPDNYKDSLIAKERITKTLNTSYDLNTAPKDLKNLHQFSHPSSLSQQSTSNSYSTSMYTPINYKPYIQNVDTSNRQADSNIISNPQLFQKSSLSQTPSLPAYVSISSSQSKDLPSWNDAPIVHAPKKVVQPASQIFFPFGQNTTRHDYSNINKNIDQFSLKTQKHTYIPPPPMMGQKYQGFSTQPVQTNTSGSYDPPSTQSNKSCTKNNSTIPETNVAGLNIYGANSANSYIPLSNFQPSMNTNYPKPPQKTVVLPSPITEQYDPIAKPHSISGPHTNQTKTLYSRQEPSPVTSTYDPNVSSMQQTLNSQIPPKEEYQRTQSSTTSNFNSKSTVSQDMKYPQGDRSHIPASLKSIFEGLSSKMEQVKLYAPPAFKRQVQDTERRLNILFDHLNNNTGLSKELLDDMKILVEAMLAKNYQLALNIHINLITTKTEECGHWMVGVKRLLEMSKSIPT